MTPSQRKLCVVFGLSNAESFCKTSQITKTSFLFKIVSAHIVLFYTLDHIRIHKRCYYRHTTTVHKNKKAARSHAQCAIIKFGQFDFFFMKGLATYFAVALYNDQNCVQQHSDASLRYFRGSTDVEFGLYSNLYQLSKLSFYYFRSQCKLYFVFIQVHDFV